MHIIIKKPVITEKSLSFASRGWYTFAVDVHARKEDIVRELKQAYNVDVTEVRTMRMPSKTRKVGRKMTTVTKSEWKKAMVQLKQGQKLDIYDVPEQQTA